MLQGRNNFLIHFYARFIFVDQLMQLQLIHLFHKVNLNLALLFTIIKNSIADLTLELIKIRKIVIVVIMELSFIITKKKY